MLFSYDQDLLIEIDFPADIGKNRRRVYRNPMNVLCAERIDQIPALIEQVEAAAREGLTAVGFLSYEAAPAFDSKLTVQEPDKSYPLSLFALFDGATSDIPSVTAEPSEICPWIPDTDFQEYRDQFSSVREAIRRGESYQVNLTLRMTSESAGDDYALYRRLQIAQNAEYSAYMRFGSLRIVSVSPELFFAWDGKSLVTRPVKGTSSRSDLPDEDDVLGQELTASAKNRAENLMIVDLLRNDLGRIAEYGSVRVDELIALERYPTFVQLASQISATTRPGVSLLQIFNSLFPCGSVTGAPKRSTMAHIAALEKGPRGIYCGAIGIIEPGLRSTFSVAIRTTVIDSVTRRATTGIGSGVTWDSTPEDEYHEIFVKAKYLSTEVAPWCLLETMKLADGRYALLEEHMSRLEASAATFGIGLENTRIRQCLASIALQHKIGEWRVRLLVDKLGCPTTEIRPLSLPPQNPKVALSRMPIKSDCIWLKHKTTRRELYQSRAEEYPDLFDVLLINERGELTEFTRGNLAVEIEGQTYTPSRSSGLLNGTLRGHLLLENKISERILTPADLLVADRIWFLNSVQGKLQVRYEP